MWVLPCLHPLTPARGSCNPTCRRKQPLKIDGWLSVALMPPAGRKWCCIFILYPVHFVPVVHSFTFTHLQCHGSSHNHDSKQRHASHPAQVHVLQDEEARPAQLLHGVGRVPHVVHSFHFELLEETAAHVAQLVEAELAVVTAHPAVSCPLAQGERLHWLSKYHLAQWDVMDPVSDWLNFTDLLREESAGGESEKLWRLHCYILLGERQKHFGLV